MEEAMPQNVIDGSVGSTEGKTDLETCLQGGQLTTF